MKKTAINTAVFLMIFLAAFYAGVGGMRSGVIVYKNKLEMQKGEIAKEKEKFLKFYPWVEKLPDLIVLLLTCCSFSLVGSSILVVRDLALKHENVITRSHTIVIISGFFIGLIILGLSYLLPVVLINEGGKIRPITLMFLSLFGGMYSNKLYEKLSHYVNKMFKEP